MATPYQFSPRIPVPPHPTPLSVTAYKANSKARRPPIHNPYDKFTQPEFDAWIGDITGALKRALGQIEADDEPKALECTQEVSTGNAMTRYRPLDLDESEDEALNDSFAEIKARRLLGKGKARDPREGPGLGGIDRTKPIEIVSSDEEEEHEVELVIGMENDESDEDEGEEGEGDYSEQEEDYPWKQGQSSSQQIFSPAKRRKYISEESEGSEGDDSEEGSEEDEEDPTTRKSRPTEVIDIVSDDEGEMDDDGQSRGHQEEEWGTEELEEGSEGLGEEFYEEEEQVRLRTSHLKSHAARVRTSRHFHYTDKEVTGDGPDIVDEIEEIQPPEANTAFPSQAPHSLVRADSPIEIPDPWAGPRIYAEDHYKGGDVRPSPGTRLDLNHLNDDDGYEGIRDVTNDKLDEDEMPVAEQDTCFSLHDEEQERPVDIAGPRVGSQIYTEVYTGADVGTHPGQEIDSTLLEGVQDNIKVPSTSQTVIPDGQDYEEDLIDDDEQLEDELEDELGHDDAAVIQPPTQHTFTPTSRLARRALPIPADAEFISIDDSDEETGLEDQEPITLDPPKVVKMDFQDVEHEDNDPPLGPVPPTTWSLSSSSNQQDGISMDYESLYANIEADTVQPEEQAEVISTLVDWNYPPAFPAGIPTSAPGHLATPSSEESNINVEESAVQALDALIKSLESANKQGSCHTVVHEEVTTQAEKDLDKVLVKISETPVDHATLSIAVDPSSSHTLSNDDTRIAESGEGVMPEEVAQGHKADVEIISEGVTQLVDEHELAPQQSWEDAVDDKIESKGSMQETDIIGVNGPPASVILDSHAASMAEDDISPPAEEIDEQTDNQTQPSTSISSVQIPVPVHHHHTYDYDQLPTPPPDQSPTAQSPSVANDGPSHAPTSQPRRHSVQIEEVEDEDDVRPQPFSADFAERNLRTDIESASEPYTVVEPELNEEQYTDEDADGEVDFDVKVVSMSSASQMWDEAQQLPMDYIVEEPLTEGRLTEEPEDRAPSLGVVSVEAEEAEAHHTSRKTGAIQDVPLSTVEEPVSLDYEISSQVDTNIKRQTSSNPDLEGPPTSATHVTPDFTSSTIERDVPMPVTANPNVVDPASCPGTPSHLSASAIPAGVDVQPQQTQSDGLFTPADKPTGVAPTSIHGQALDKLAQAFPEIPSVSSTPVEELVPISNPDLLTDIDLGIDRAIEQIEAPLQLPPIGTDLSSAQPSGNIHATTSGNGPISTPPLPDPPVSMHVTLIRKPTDPILVSDPYPYSLSTPGSTLMDPTGEDSEHDYSMSSNSTFEKDLEDKDTTNSIPDDVNEPELQYPLEPDILSELNVVACLPQSASVQPADLPTGDGAVAPGLISGTEIDDVSPREILPIEPAQRTSSGDLPLTGIANHDLPTTPPNVSISTRALKRKRGSSRPPLEKVAPTTTSDKVEKRKNKVSGKGKAKATNQEVIDQVTSQATIHVKPRQKTQPVGSRALPENFSGAWAASHSSSGASATHKRLLPSSRSSSVASSVHSDQSVAVVVLPSPTVHKPNVRLAQTSPRPVSLFHAHGHKRNQNNQLQSNQTRTHTIQPMPSIQRVISLPRIDDPGSTATTPTAISPTVVTSPTCVTPPVIMKAVPPPALRHAPAISGSPVTRSHCRYHRISLPREGGPRVCFLVPGCSISDRELMAAKEIEDHGDATQEDSLRMIKDIQSLDFDSYLIGTLRHLVGLDILREQEVFYLPQPGEEVVRKTSPRKERSGVFRGAESSSYAGSPVHSGSIRSPGSMKAPTSLADSTSTSFSTFRRRLDSEKGSSVHSDTELEPSVGEFSPDAKRARPSPPDEQGPMGPPPKAQGGKRQLKGRRSKPIEEVHEGNSTNTQFRIVQRPTLAIKRRRGSEMTVKDEDEERVLKKLKIPPSIRGSAT